MEIVHELRLSATIIDRNAKSGDLPFGVTSKDDLLEKIKSFFDPDQINMEIQSFELDSAN